MKNNFNKALKEDNRELFIKMPKSDLHNHSALGCKLKVFEKKTGIELSSPPKKMKSITEMDSYIFSVLAPAFMNDEGFDISFNESLRQAYSDGVTVLRMSIDCFFADFFEGKEYGLVNKIKEISSKYDNKLKFLPQIGFARGREKSYYKLAQACIETGFFESVDLYGNELIQDAKDFKPLYKLAKKTGMRLIAHAGEFGSAQSVRETIETLELDEVQHGISIASSPEIMKWVADNKIRLNICPSSNICMTRVRNYKLHPIKILFDNGIIVTINTDDIMLFGQTVCDEYFNLYKSGCLTAEELNTIREYGISLATTRKRSIK